MQILIYFLIYTIGFIGGAVYQRYSRAARNNNLATFRQGYELGKKASKQNMRNFTVEKGGDHEKM